MMGLLRALPHLSLIFAWLAALVFLRGGTVIAWEGPSVNGSVATGGSPLEPPHLEDVMLNRFIVVPEIKLLFCYVEKVGCTTFNDLFSLLRRTYDKSLPYFSDPKVAPHHNWFLDGPKRHGLDREGLEKLLADPAWTKAVFYRDPVVRFLSAYRSKCEPGHDNDMFHCKRAFGSERASFKAAVAALNGPKPAQDPHWRPQSQFCGGLARNLHHYDFVEELKLEESHAAVTRLLSMVGYDPQRLQPHFNQLFPPPNAATGAVATGGYNAASHITHADDKLCKYFSEPKLVSKVVEYYRSDYKAFGMKPEAICGFDPEAHYRNHLD